MKWDIGFSWVGAAYLVALFIPNLIWARHKSEGYSGGGEPWALVLLERVGQVGTTVFVLFGDITFLGWNPWLVVSLLFLALYEVWWGWYFSGKPTLGRMYGRFLGFPSPGAVLPVLSFLCLAISAKKPVLVVCVCILGVGHIGIHLKHWRDCDDRKTQGK